MSFSKWVLVLVAVIVIVLGLWWTGILGGSMPKQGAAVVTSQPADQALSAATIKADVAKIDVQLTLASTPLAATLNKGDIASAAAAVNTSVKMMRALAVKFQSISANAKATGSATPSAQALADLSVQLSNASSQAGTAFSAATASSTKAASLKIAAGYVVTSQGNLKVARADIQTILDGMK